MGRSLALFLENHKFILSLLVRTIIVNDKAVYTRMPIIYVQLHLAINHTTHEVNQNTQEN